MASCNGLGERHKKEMYQKNERRDIVSKNHFLKYLPYVSLPFIFLIAEDISENRHQKIEEQINQLKIECKSEAVRLLPVGGNVDSIADANIKKCDSNARIYEKKTKGLHMLMPFGYARHLDSMYKYKWLARDINNRRNEIKKTAPARNRLQMRGY